MLDHLTRDAQHTAQSAGTINLRGVAIELASGTAVRGDDRLSLTPDAMSLLLHLARNTGRVISKSELMDIAWPGVHVTEDSLTLVMREIRLALGDDDHELLRAISRRGYILAGPMRCAPPGDPGQLTVDRHFGCEAGDATVQPKAARNGEVLASGFKRQAGQGQTQSAPRRLRVNDPFCFDAATAKMEEADPGDPRCGDGLAHMAFSLAVKSGGGLSTMEDLSRPLELVQRAVALSPGLPVVHRVASLIRQFRREYEAAERHMQRAVELDPGDPDAIGQMGHLVILRGRPLEGLAWIASANRIGIGPTGRYELDRGVAFYLLGDYRAAANAIELAPSSPLWVRAWLAACYAQLGELETAGHHTSCIPADEPGFAALGYASGDGSVFEHASDSQHFAEGLYLALGLIKPKPR